MDSRVIRVITYRVHMRVINFPYLPLGHMKRLPVHAKTDARVSHYRDVDAVTVNKRVAAVYMRPYLRSWIELCKQYSYERAARPKVTSELRQDGWMSASNLGC
jgi:hypothetical protein